MPKKSSQKKTRSRKLSKRKSQNKSRDRMRQLPTRLCNNFVELEEQEFGNKIVFHIEGEYKCSGFTRDEFIEKIHVPTYEGGSLDSQGYVFFINFVSISCYVHFNDIRRCFTENRQETVFYLTKTNNLHGTTPRYVYTIEAENKLICDIVENNITHNITKGEVIRQLKDNYGIGLSNLSNKPLDQLCNLLQAKVQEDIQEALNQQRQQQIYQEENLQQPMEEDDEELQQAIQLSLQPPVQPMEEDEELEQTIQTGLQEAINRPGNKAFIKSLIDVSKKCLGGLVESCKIMLADPTVQQIVSGSKDVYSGAKKVIGGSVRGIVKGAKWSGKKALSGTKWTLSKSARVADAIVDYLEKKGY